MLEDPVEPSTSNLSSKDRNVREAAWCAFYEYWSIRVLKSVRSRFPALEEERVVSAAHDAFVTLHRRSLDPSFDVTKAHGFVYTVAKRRAIDEWRRQVKWRKRTVSQEEDGSLSVDTFASKEPGSDRIAESRDLCARLEDEIDGFPDRQRQVALLMLYSSNGDKLSPSEICEAARNHLGVTLTPAVARSARDAVINKLKMIVERFRSFDK